MEGRQTHCIVSGRVQGVGFRWFTQKAASTLNIRGWVRNLPSGEVEIYALGSEHNLTAFLEKVKRGPLAASVHSLKTDIPKDIDWPEYFEIR